MRVGARPQPNGRSKSTLVAYVVRHTDALLKENNEGPGDALLGFISSVQAETIRVLLPVFRAGDSSLKMLTSGLARGWQPQDGDKEDGGPVTGPQFGPGWYLIYVDAESLGHP